MSQKFLCITQKIKFWRVKEETYKIDIIKQNDLNNKISDYIKKSKLILLIEVPDYPKLKNHLIQILSKKFIQMKKYGKRYFNGNCIDIKKLCMKEINKIDIEKDSSKEEISEVSNIAIEKINKYKCNLCNKEFKKKTDYTRHLNRKNPCVINLTCLVCGIKFARKDSLNRHINDKCKKSFDKIIKDSLIKKDNNKKSYKCKTCTNEFDKVDDYSKHIIHLCNKKLTTCDKCKKDCICYTQLQEHLREYPNCDKNINNALWYCKLCNTQFDRKYNFRRHLKICVKKSHTDIIIEALIN